MIEGTLLAWCEALDGLYIESRDAPRIQAAFRELMRSCVNWPSPADLRAAMQQQRVEGKRESHLKLVDDASQRRGLQHVEAIIRKLNRGDPGEEQSA